MPGPLPPELRALLRRQRGVAHRGQLRAGGVNAHAVDRACAAGRWVTCGPVVVVADNGDLDVEQLRWVAVLHCGASSALCAWTALQDRGLQGFERPDVHVVVPRGVDVAPLPPLPGRGAARVVLHESRRHRPDDVQRGRGVPAHHPARAAVDAAAWGPSNRAATGVVAAVVQQGLASTAQVRAALDAAGAVNRRRLVAAVLGDVEGGATALSEIDFARLCRAAGLPEPRRQRRRRDRDGRFRYLDVEWVRSDGRRVVVEVDGRGHLRQARWEDDLLRANDITIGDGAMVLRVPSTVLRSEPELVLRQLRQALAVPPLVSTAGREDALQY